MWETGRTRRLPDTGIDLVAKERDTAGTARSSASFTSRITTCRRRTFDSFFTASGKAPFTSRIIVSTTDKWGIHAEEALDNQQTPVTRLGLSDIGASPIDWDIVWPKPGDPVELQLLPGNHLRPHQSTALKDVFVGFEAHDRGKLIMACGTGKTFTSLKIAEQVSKPRESTSRRTCCSSCRPSRCSAVSA